MRAVAVGRKNHYGSRSLRGTPVAALFYSLIESAKLTGLEPSAYLAKATRRAIDKPGTVTLPRDLASAQPPNHRLHWRANFGDFLIVRYTGHGEHLRSSRSGESPSAAS